MLREKWGFRRWRKLRPPYSLAENPRQYSQRSTLRALLRLWRGDVPAIAQKSDMYLRKMSWSPCQTVLLQNSQKFSLAPHPVSPPASPQFWAALPTQGIRADA